MIHSATTRECVSEMACHTVSRFYYKKSRMHSPMSSSSLLLTLSSSSSSLSSFHYHHHCYQYHYHHCVLLIFIISIISPFIISITFMTILKDPLIYSMWVENIEVMNERITMYCNLIHLFIHIQTKFSSML